MRAGLQQQKRLRLCERSRQSVKVPRRVLSNELLLLFLVQLANCTLSLAEGFFMFSSSLMLHGATGS